MSAVIAIAPRQKHKRISQINSNEQGPDSSDWFIECSPLYFKDLLDKILTFEVSRFSVTTGRWGK